MLAPKFNSFEYAAGRCLDPFFKKGFSFQGGSLDVGRAFYDPDMYSDLEYVLDLSLARQDHQKLFLFRNDYFNFFYSSLASYKDEDFSPRSPSPVAGFMDWQVFFSKYLILNQYNLEDPFITTPDNGRYDFAGYNELSPTESSFVDEILLDDFVESLDYILQFELKIFAQRGDFFPFLTPL